MRARLIGGLPADLVCSLTGPDAGPLPRPRARPPTPTQLTDARRQARSRTGDNAAERGRVRPDAHAASTSTPSAGAPVDRGQRRRDHQRSGTPSASAATSSCSDVYGNTYTYAHLETGRRAPTRCPKPQTSRSARSQRELELPHADPKPTAPARPAGSASRRAGRRRPSRRATPRRRRPAASRRRKERLFANPRRPAACAPPAARAQLADAGAELPQARHAAALLHRGYGLEPRDVDASSALRKGAQRHRRHDPRPRRPDRPRNGARTCASRSGRPAGRAAHRPEADPRRLEAAGVDRDLPRRRQRTRSSAHDAEDPVDRPDPAHEQGGARSSASSPTRASRSTAAAARDIQRRRHRPPRARHARVPRRLRPASRPSPRCKCGHGYMTALGQRLRALLRQRRRHRRHQRHPDRRPPGRGLDHRHHDPPAAHAPGHDEAPPDHLADDLPRRGQHARAGRPLRPHPRRLPRRCTARTRRAPSRTQRGPQARASGSS